MIETANCYDALCRVMPGGVNSPIRACKAVDHPPMVVERGAGSLIYDIHGHEFIDYCGSWGALIHGHAHPGILAKAYAQMLKGTTFGITTASEGKLAEKVIELIPSMEMVRFVSTGTEATMSA